MRRRGTANGQPGKGRRRNTRRPKARKTPAAHLPIADLQEQLDWQIHERDEQLAATSEVLKVISNSPGKLEPVFDAMLANATRLCEARFGVLYLRDGDAFRAVASSRDAPPAYVEARRREPVIHPGPGTALSRAAATRQPVQIADIRAEPAYTNDPARFAILNLAGARTYFAVPMTKENEVIGIFAIYRQEVRPFTVKQIELVQNFAAQTVIAVENTRLLNELRESLQQQTATADVLKVISSSPGELEPVFDAMLANATRICEARFGVLYLREGGDFRAAVTTRNAPPEYVKARKPELLLNPPPDGPLRRVTATKHVVQITDLSKLQSYLERHPFTVAAVELGRFRTALGVPMLRDGEVIGCITILRQEVRPFTDKQVELLTNFAAQAVIAIENTRLLNELRERTEEISKLNQQLEQRVSDQVGEIERMGRLRRFLPPQVADLIVASGTEKQLESHRQEITALFCDLRGFTGFSESSDPEDVMALLAEYHAAIGKIIIKYSGTLERYAGDGVMVIFNDPVPSRIRRCKLS